jgi:hypothetical protein
MDNARAVIEVALAEVKEKLAQAERDRKRFLENAQLAAGDCRDLRKAIAAYHKALGRKADGSERKVRGAGKAETSAHEADRPA